MIKWIGKLLDRAFAVVGALIISQVPLYMQQYSQQLSGHVSELHIQIEALKKVASLGDKTIEQYIQKFLESTDLDFRAQGEYMQMMVDRESHLAQGLIALQNAIVWERPYVFAKYLNWDIASATLKFYKIGIPLTLEGAVYAFAGMLVGYALFLLLRKLIALLLSPFIKMFRKSEALPVEKINEPL